MRNASGAILLTVLLAACAAPAPSASPGTSPPESPAPAPTGSATPGPQASVIPTQSPQRLGFYLRAWYEQALPPIHTFGELPLLTIFEGVAIDGNVAIPAIYPGPLLIIPFARPISDAGMAAIVDEARQLGLLGDTTDFTGGEGMPGAQLARLQLVVDGVTHDLVGMPDPGMGCGMGGCEGEAGSPEAFTTFWQDLLTLDAWIGDELGPQGQYDPERVAVLFTPPAPPEPGLQQPPIAWPLDEPLDEAGVEFPGGEGRRCATLSGEDLDAVLPALQRANQLTVFHDGFDGQWSLVAAVVVPGAESPCPDEG